MSNNGGDQKISRKVMQIECVECGRRRSYFPQSIRHMQMTPRCECGVRQWRDILGCPVHFGNWKPIYPKESSDG